MTKLKINLNKIIDRFLDGHGNYANNLVSPKLKSFYTNNFLNPKEICINQLVVQLMKLSHPSGT